VPNTLAHLGVQAVATRAVIKAADLKWICVGCVVPDLPWIMQRIVAALPVGISPLDLRLYAIVQSTLTASLILCGAISAFSSRPALVFRILAVNVMLHLLLDSLQIKWANGVHLLAPFDWELFNIGLFWPESPITILLNVLGLGVVVYIWYASPGNPVSLSFKRRINVAGGVSLTLIYVVAPVGFLDGPEQADNHSVKTLRETEFRAGRYVEFDRNSLIRDESGDRIQTLSGEEIAVVGVPADAPATISAKGRFIDNRTVVVNQTHGHWPLARDLASIVGLSLVALIWIVCLLGRPANRT